MRINNEVALKLYKSLNFTIEETLKDYYTDPISDAYVMIWKENKKYECKKKLNIVF